MDRQLQMRLELEEDATAFALSAELQDLLVALMADAIVAAVEQEGGEGDEHADVQRED